MQPSKRPKSKAERRRAISQATSRLSGTPETQSLPPALRALLNRTTTPDSPQQTPKATPDEFTRPTATPPSSRGSFTDEQRRRSVTMRTPALEGFPEPEAAAGLADWILSARSRPRSAQRRPSESVASTDDHPIYRYRSTPMTRPSRTTIKRNQDLRSSAQAGGWSAGGGSVERVLVGRSTRLASWQESEPQLPSSPEEVRHVDSGGESSDGSRPEMRDRELSWGDALGAMEAVAKESDGEKESDDDQASVLETRRQSDRPVSDDGSDDHVRDIPHEIVYSKAASIVLRERRERNGEEAAILPEPVLDSQPAAVAPKVQQDDSPPSPAKSQRNKFVFDPVVERTVLVEGNRSDLWKDCVRDAALDSHFKTMNASIAAQMARIHASDSQVQPVVQKAEEEEDFVSWSDDGVKIHQQFDMLRLLGGSTTRDVHQRDVLVGVKNARDRLGEKKSVQPSFRGEVLQKVRQGLPRSQRIALALNDIPLPEETAIGDVTRWRF